LGTSNAASASSLLNVLRLRLSAYSAWARGWGVTTAAPAS